MLRIKLLDLVEVLNRFFELTEAGVRFPPLVMGLGRFRRLLDHFIVVLNGTLVLLLGKISIGPAEKRDSQFGILSQGFLKVLYSIVVLSELVVSQSPIIVDLGGLRIAKKRIVIILDGELVLFRFIVVIASLVVSVGKIGVEANDLIVIFDRPAR